MSSAPRRFPSLLLNIGTWAAIAGIVSTLIGLIAFLFQVNQSPPHVREITCSVLSNGELTASANTEGLSATFAYMNAPVSHLWKLTMTCLNTGDQTIVGDAEATYLISKSGIVIEILGIPKDMPSSTGSNVSAQDNASNVGINVVKAEIENTNPPNLGVTVNPGPAQSPNQVTLYFKQWRKSEKASFSMYIKSDSDYAHLKPQFTDRGIIDGSTIIYDLTAGPTPSVSVQQQLLQILPNSWRGAGGIITKLLACLGAVLLIILGIRLIINGWSLRAKGSSLSMAILAFFLLLFVALDIVTFLL
jgi:hypothetical protein